MRVFLYLVSAAAAFAFIRWVLHLLKLSRRRGIGRDEFVLRLPSDTLKTTYRICGDDLEEVLADIAHRLGYEMPHSGILSTWLEPINDLEDVVRFLEWVCTQQGTAAP